MHLNIIFQNDKQAFLVNKAADHCFRHDSAANEGKGFVFEHGRSIDEGEGDAKRETVSPVLKQDSRSMRRGHSCNSYLKNPSL